MSSTETHEIVVFLNAPQFLKYRKSKPFQLSNTQLQADNGKHKVDIHLDKKDYRKLLLSVKNKKGFRFSEKNVKGGSLWGSFKSGLSKVANFVKKNVNKEDVKNVINKGVDMVAPESVKNVTKSAVGKLVDYGYDDSNAGKSLKENVFSIANELQPELQDVGKQVGQKALDKIKERFNGNAEVGGEGFKKFKKGSQEAKDFMAKIRGLRKAKSVSAGSGLHRSGKGIRDNVPLKSRPIKGSQEAKDKMAKLRALRKGSGFFDNIASALIHTGLPTLGHVAGEFLGGPIGAMAGESLGNMAGDAIGEATGRGLQNTTHTLYGQHVNGIPYPVVSNGSVLSVKKNGYKKKQRGVNGLHIHGGSFLTL